MERSRFFVEFTHDTELCVGCIRTGRLRSPPMASRALHRRSPLFQAASEAKFVPLRYIWDQTLHPGMGFVRFAAAPRRGDLGIGVPWSGDASRPRASRPT